MSGLELVVLLVSLVTILTAAVAVAVVLLAPDDEFRADVGTPPVPADRASVAARDPVLEDLPPLSVVRRRDARGDRS